LKNSILFALLFVACVTNAYSQISPPGLGKAHAADWFALGLRQELDTIDGKGWQSMTYIGLGRKSNPNNFDPFYKAAILVFNQEFYHQFHNNWQYSMALSYRRQNEYSEKQPYENKTPAIKQEFRLYGRFSYTYKTPHIKFVPTLRQEIRKFYTPDFKNPSENFQFRSRIRLQLTINLNRKKTHRLITSSEQLFSISNKIAPNSWTDFNYRESRFLLYYSYSPKTLPFIISVGYMNNLVGQKNPYTVHCLAFDITIANPFKLQQRKKENIKENFE